MMQRILCLLICTIAFAVSVMPANAETVSCDWSLPVKKWAGNQMELNQCASEKFEHADKLMNKLYSQKLAAVEDIKTRKDFRDAQRAWVVFRDKTCLYEVGRQEESGSAFPMQNMLCLSDLTDRRNETLQHYVKCHESGCH